MSIDKLQQLVGSLAQTVEDNQKLATPILAAKLAKCVNAYPEDQTLGAMSRVIEKMAENNTMFIKKAELKQLYNKLYSRNTKFAQLFTEELGLSDNLPSPTLHKRDESKSAIDPYEHGDAVLANALNSVFDKHEPLKMYAQNLADKAKVAVGTSLDAWNLKPTSLNIDTGNDKFIVIKADYETPKGLTSFYVPVEIHDGKLSQASVFMGNFGPQELDNTNVKNYLLKSAGAKLKVDGASILGVLTSAASEKREVSGAELALSRLNTSRKVNSEFFADQIVGLKVEAAGRPDVQLDKSDEFKSFEEKFTSPYGQAAFNFGEDKVKLARDHIARELVGMGHKNPQIAVTASDKSSVFYGVSLDAGKVAFTVPVKFANNRMQKPSLLICNGSASTFDAAGINNLYLNNEVDYKVAAVASPQFGLKPSELLNNIRTAMAEGNHTKAEDALNVLKNMGDAKAYATAFQLFMGGLAPKTASSEHKCSLMVKNATSEHMICGHTGLPVHKVYQDKDGNCRPMYRRGMDESYEGASFMNAKIFG